MAAVVTEPRFYVVTVTGWNALSRNGRGGCSTSYSVLDSAQAHIEVFCAYANEPLNNRGDAKRKARAVRECERRNNLDAAGCAA